MTLSPLESLGLIQPTDRLIKNTKICSFACKITNYN